MKGLGKELILFGVACGLIAFMLISSLVGYQQAGYVAEFNPIAKIIFEMMWGLTGNLSVAVLIFVPIAILGVWFAGEVVDRDLRKVGYVKGKHVVFLGLIFLLIPNALYNARILKIDLRVLTLLCLGLAGAYLVTEWLRWKKQK